LEETRQHNSNQLNHFIGDYWDIFLGITAIILAFYFHSHHSILLSTLFAATGIGALSITVSEIAEILSEKLAEPYGSFVLTFSAVVVEVILLYLILLQSHTNPDAIDTVKGGIISAVIVDMNVLLGLAMFVGGIAYKQQEHNEETSSAYTTLLFVAGIGLLVPSLLNESKHSPQDIAEVSTLISILLMAFYLVIVVFQTKTHTHFFKQTAKSRIFRLKRKQKEEDEDDDYIFEKFPNIGLIGSIFVFIAIIALGAEVFAEDGMELAKHHGISTGLAGLAIAIISASPEIMTAIKAARDNEIQRVVNIAMGASTVSILLTVPVLMFLAFLSDVKLTLDFNPLEIGALLFTIILAWKSTDEGKTNYFEGISHLIFFLLFAIMATYY